jgi:hypothetical protein
MCRSTLPIRWRAVLRRYSRLPTRRTGGSYQREQTLAQMGSRRRSGSRQAGAGRGRSGGQDDNNVPVGCVRVAAAHASTAMLGDMFGSISVERA